MQHDFQLDFIPEYVLNRYSLSALGLYDFLNS